MLQEWHGGREVCQGVGSAGKRAGLRTGRGMRGCHGQVAKLSCRVHVSLCMMSGDMVKGSRWWSYNGYPGGLCTGSRTLPHSDVAFWYH